MGSQTRRRHHAPGRHSAVAPHPLQRRHRPALSDPRGEVTPRGAAPPPHTSFCGGTLLPNTVRAELSITSLASSIPASNTPPPTGLERQALHGRVTEKNPPSRGAKLSTQLLLRSF